MSSFVLSNVYQHFDMLLALPMLIGFVVSVIATWLLCRLSKLLSIGHDISHGVQKFHVNPTSRLGGVAIFLGFAFSGLVVSGSANLSGEQHGLSTEFRHYSFWFLLASVPVWLAGLTEDLTHRVGPTLRLVMATMSAAWLFGALSVSVNRTDVWPIDLLLSMPGAPLCVTLLVVAGFIHSVNIVDGFHGLACGLVIIALSGLVFMAWKVGDALLLQMCLTSLAVVFGFIVFNWPKGAIFLGDSGAYLIGFWVVELGVLLAMRNPQISPMAPVVVGLLPLIETLFSMYRRNVLTNNPVNQPDALHLHTLVYRRLLFNPELAYTSDQLNAVNAKVALFFWVPAVLFAGLGCTFYESTKAQLLLMVGYLLMYNWLYKRLVRFKTPNFMRFR
jgi:UDP-N-acetylmuramyl pentapeptide phosphotransferase/UDP-N-acetylglucosamine-1-phosphate transferase